MLKSVTWSVLLVLGLGVSACRHAQKTQNPAPLAGSPGTPSEDEAPQPEREDPFTEIPLLEAPVASVTTLPSMTLVQGTSEVRYSFGSADDLGFVWWASNSGKLVVWMRFEDSNGDGRIEPAFDQHGEPVVDGFTPYLVDVYSGQTTRVAEVLTWDSSHRYLAVRPEQGEPGLVIWDAETMTVTPVDENWGLDLTGDGNACLRPRQAYLSPDGMFWGIARDEHAVIGRSVVDSDTPHVRIELGEDVRVWRVEPASPRWLSLMLVSADSNRNGALDLPLQNTSCACRACNRFALSHGVYGWSGDAWSVKLASPTGVLAARDMQSFASPLTPDVFMDVASEELYSWPEGTPLSKAPPKDCVRAAWLSGEAPRVMMSCGDGRAMLWSVNEPTLELPVQLVTASEQVVQSSALGTHWFAAIVKTAQDELHVARVRMEDGYVELGEHVYEQVPAVTSREQGRIEVVLQDRVEVIEVSTGRRWHGEVLASEERLLFTSSGASVSIPVQPPSFVTSGGCVLAASSHDSRRIERGPWQVTCVKTIPSEPLNKEP